MLKVQTTISVRLLRNQLDIHIYRKMATKQWKRNPPGKAHVILQEMFQKKQIPPDALANAVHRLNPEFQKFSLAVFRGAFNELRSKYGLGCKYFSTTYNCF